jgi:hypothetical protein
VVVVVNLLSGSLLYRITPTKPASKDDRLMTISTTTNPPRKISRILNRDSVYVDPAFRDVDPPAEQAIRVRAI